LEGGFEWDNIYVEVFRIRFCPVVFKAEAGGFQNFTLKKLPPFPFDRTHTPSPTYNNKGEPPL